MAKDQGIMDTCHLCGGPLPHHHDHCRAHQDLEMFIRVYRRLRAEARNPTLQDKLMHQLMRHGRLAAAMGEAA